jgi:hypothetical protein
METKGSAATTSVELAGAEHNAGEMKRPTPLVFFSICAVVDFALGCIKGHSVPFCWLGYSCHSVWLTIDGFAGAFRSHSFSRTTWWAASSLRIGLPDSEGLILKPAPELDPDIYVGPTNGQS